MTNIFATSGFFCHVWSKFVILKNAYEFRTFYNIQQCMILVLVSWTMWWAFVICFIFVLFGYCIYFVMSFIMQNIVHIMPPLLSTWIFVNRSAGYIISIFPIDKIKIIYHDILHYSFSEVMIVVKRFNLLQTYSLQKCAKYLHMWQLVLNLCICLSPARSFSMNIYCLF